MLGIDPNTNFVYSLSSSTKVEELFVVQKEKTERTLFTGSTNGARMSNIFIQLS